MAIHSKDGKPPLSRALAMQEHSFDIAYLKGTENTIVDSLSHNPVSDSQTVAITSSQTIIGNIQRA